MALVVQNRVCLGDSAIPLREQCLDFHDLHTLAEGDLDGQVFLLLSLKASGDLRWLERGFKLSAKWWVRNHMRVPLLKEIRQAIETKKSRSGGGSRLPKLANTLVAIKIREKVILVQNQPLFVNLAFHPGEEIEGLQWIINELKKYIDHLKEESSESSQDDDDEGEDDEHEEPQGSLRVSKQQRHPLSKNEQQIVENSLKNIREHSECLRATFLPSRCAFRVFKKDKSKSEFRVSDLKKKNVRWPRTERTLMGGRQ